MTKLNSQSWVHSGCPDCGETLYHPQSGGSFDRTLRRVFSNVHMEVFEDDTIKHFIVILKTEPVEKVYASCQQPLHRIPDMATEIEMMEWAAELEDRV